VSESVSQSGLCLARPKTKITEHLLSVHMKQLCSDQNQTNWIVKFNQCYSTEHNTG